VLSGEFVYAGPTAAVCSHTAKFGFHGLPIPAEDGYNILDGPATLHLRQVGCESLELEAVMIRGGEQITYHRRYDLRPGQKGVTITWGQTGLTYQWKGKPKGPKMGISRITAELFLDLLDPEHLRLRYSHTERGAALLVIPFKNVTDLDCLLPRAGPRQEPVR